MRQHRTVQKTFVFSFLCVFAAFGLDIIYGQFARAWQSNDKYQAVQSERVLDAIEQTVADFNEADSGLELLNTIPHVYQQPLFEALWEKLPFTTRLTLATMYGLQACYDKLTGQNSGTADCIGGNAYTLKQEMAQQLSPTALSSTGAAIHYTGESDLTFNVVQKDKQTLGITLGDDLLISFAADQPLFTPSTDFKQLIDQMWEVIENHHQRESRAALWSQSAYALTALIVIAVVLLLFLIANLVSYMILSHQWHQDRKLMREQQMIAATLRSLHWAEVERDQPELIQALNAAQVYLEGERVFFNLPKRLVGIAKLRDYILYLSNFADSLETMPEFHLTEVGVEKIELRQLLREIVGEWWAFVNENASGANSDDSTKTPDADVW